jgi:hypothetical protein
VVCPNGLEKEARAFVCSMRTRNRRGKYVVWAGEGTWGVEGAIPDVLAWVRRRDPLPGSDRPYSTLPSCPFCLSQGMIISICSIKRASSFCLSYVDDDLEAGITGTS